MSDGRKTDKMLWDEYIYRPDVWHFYAYFAGKAWGILGEFMEVADIEDKIGRYRKYSDVEPSKVIERKDFKTFVRAFQKLLDFRNKVEDGDYTRINFWRGDVIGWLADALHQLVNILPYLNDRHFTLSEERYAAASRQYSLDELRNLDRTLARKILPTLEYFDAVSAFIPLSLRRRYAYPHPQGTEPSKKYSSYHLWNKMLRQMVRAWRWLAEREPTVKDGWEDVPEDIYYGLHLFAEYLPEMQND